MVGGRFVSGTVVAGRSGGGGGGGGRIVVYGAKVKSGHGRWGKCIGSRFIYIANIEIKIAISVHLPYSGSQSALRASLRQLIMSAPSGFYFNPPRLMPPRS